MRRAWASSTSTWRCRSWRADASIAFWTASNSARVSLAARSTCSVPVRWAVSTSVRSSARSVRRRSTSWRRTAAGSAGVFASPVRLRAVADEPAAAGQAGDQDRRNAGGGVLEAPRTAAARGAAPRPGRSHAHSPHRSTGAVSRSTNRPPDRPGYPGLAPVGARRGPGVSCPRGRRDAAPAPRPTPAPPGALADPRGGRAGALVLAGPHRPPLRGGRPHVGARDGPWRATEDGYVTPEVLDWYARFAEGQPGVLVVEATGIRDIPSGPLLRIGSDRFVPGLQPPGRDRAGAERGPHAPLHPDHRLRRRPPAAGAERRTSRATSRSATTSGAAWPRRSATRAGRTRPRCRTPRCARAWPAPSAPLVEAVLTARELEALDYGYRERVWDIHLPHIRDLPRVLPDLFAEAARAGARGGLRRRRAPLRARLHDGLVPLADEPPRRTATAGRARQRARLPLEVLHAVRDARRRRLRGRHPLPRPRRGGGGQRRRRRGLVRRSASPRPAPTTCRCRRAGASRTPGSPRSARRSIPTPASRATSACPP